MEIDFNTLPQFTGTRQDLQDITQWLKQYQVFGHYHKLDEKSVIMYARLFLQGPALTFYETLRGDALENWDVFSSEFIPRFGMQIEELIAEFMSVKQNPNEDIHAFCDYFVSLTTQLQNYGEPPCETLMKQQFIRALDESLRTPVVFHRPKSLAEAIDAAKYFSKQNMNISFCQNDAHQSQNYCQIWPDEAQTRGNPRQARSVSRTKLLHQMHLLKELKEELRIMGAQLRDMAENGPSFNYNEDDGETDYLDPPDHYDGYNPPYESDEFFATREENSGSDLCADNSHCDDYFASYALIEEDDCYHQHPHFQTPATSVISNSIHNSWHQDNKSVPCTYSKSASWDHNIHDLNTTQSCRTLQKHLKRCYKSSANQAPLLNSHADFPLSDDEQIDFQNNVKESSLPEQTLTKCYSRQTKSTHVMSSEDVVCESPRLNETSFNEDSLNIAEYQTKDQSKAAGFEPNLVSSGNKISHVCDEPQIKHKPAIPLRCEQHMNATNNVSQCNLHNLGSQKVLKSSDPLVNVQINALKAVKYLDICGPDLQNVVDHDSINELALQLCFLDPNVQKYDPHLTSLVVSNEAINTYGDKCDLKGVLDAKQQSNENVSHNNSFVKEPGKLKTFGCQNKTKQTEASGLESTSAPNPVRPKPPYSPPYSKKRPRPPETSPAEPPIQVPKRLCSIKEGIEASSNQTVTSDYHPISLLHRLDIVPQNCDVLLRACKVLYVNTL